MPFLRHNIDRAIVMTQYDLRGFAHPLGVRLSRLASPKSFDTTTGNFVAFAAKSSSDKGPTDESYVHYLSDSTYEQVLTMCKKLASDCECSSQKEAIQLIIKEFVKQNEEFWGLIGSGKRSTSKYLFKLDKTNRWGRLVLALAEAFEVDVGTAAAAA